MCEPEIHETVRVRKEELRRRLYAIRRDVDDKQQRSDRAILRLIHLLDVSEARTVLWYVDCRSELRTRRALVAELAGNSRRPTIVVPYCTVTASGSNQLGLWRLESLVELAEGRWGILEPPLGRWREPNRRVEPTDLDAVVVPGVAFDAAGNRLGNGQGYYDALLPLVRDDCMRIGLCFEAQIVERFGTDPHDVPVDYVVTDIRSWRTGLGPPA